MKHIPAAFVFLFGAVSAFAGGKGWTDDYGAAAKLAESGGKNLLIEFTGSDWCTPCIMLEKKVLSQDIFIKAMKDKFVLVQLDYPNDTSKLSQATIAQNRKLQKRYGIAAFPTVLLADAAGRPFYVESGLAAGGPGEFSDKYLGMLVRKKKRDEALKSAAKLEGVEKAKALVKALKGLKIDEAAMVDNLYADVIAEIKKADPDDTTGYVKGIGNEGRFSKFEAEIDTIDSEKGSQAAIDYAKKALVDGSFSAEQRDDIGFIIGDLYVALEEYDKAIEVLKAVRKSTKDADFIEILDEFINEIVEMKKGGDSQKK